MPSGFFSSLKTAGTSPYAFAAYIALICAWVYVVVAQYRLKRISKIIAEVPAEQRAALLAKEYHVLPRSGLSADQWIRSRKHTLFFFAFLSILVAIVVVVVIALTVNPRPADDPKETVITDPQIGPNRIPKEMTAPLPNLSVQAMSEELRHRGSLTLDNSTLTIGAVNAHVTFVLACYILRLQNGARIITNGNLLVLSPWRLVLSGNGGISSFVGDSKQAPAGSLGQPGLPGADGGRVELKPLFDFQGILQVYLPGQDGGRGGPGSIGQQGAPGVRGDDASSGAFGCSHGGGNGSQGSPGGMGGPGAPGGKGGNGGVLVLAGKLTSQKAAIEFAAPGGMGGDGGPGGLGGPGGPPGQGGSGSGFCSGGAPGIQGISGPAGENGTKGQNGRSGVIEAS